MELFRIRQNTSNIDNLFTDGRWHSVGTPCVYVAESIANAMVEYSIHHDYRLPKVELTILRYTVKSELVYKVPIDQLPVGFEELDYNPICQAFGTRLLQQDKTAILQLPSAIIPDEFIFVLNLAHPDIKDNKPEYIGNFIPGTSLRNWK